MPKFEVWAQITWEVDAGSEDEAKSKIQGMVTLGNPTDEEWEAHDPNEPPPQGFRG